MDAEEMRAKVLETLGRFAALKHKHLEALVLSGHYSLASVQAFEKLIDELAANGSVCRSERFGWVRLPSPQVDPPRPPARAGRLRSGSRAVIRS